MTGLDVNAAVQGPTASSLLVPQPYRVVGRVQETSDVVTLHVLPADGSPPPAFRPAQCGMVGAFGIGEAAISISSPVTTTDHHAYTIRAVGPISQALVDTPIDGYLTVRSPFGTPWPIDDLNGGQLLVVAGGLGIAPLRAAIDEAVSRIGDFDRLALVYGAKNPDQLVFSQDRDRWTAAGLETALIVDEGDDDWSGPVGVVPDLLGSDIGVDMDWASTTAFVCGPDIMMHFTAAALSRLGVPDDQIWFTLERNMQCGNALCGHCQLGPFIICRDGPVVRYDRIAPFHPIVDL